MDQHGAAVLSGIQPVPRRCLISSGKAAVRDILETLRVQGRRLLFLVATGAMAPVIADAQVLETRSFRVEFARGQSSIVLREGLTGREMVLYRITAAKGQVMTADLSATNAGTSFNLYRPGSGPGDQALAIGDQIGPNVPAVNRIRVTLPSDGTYTISVFLNRAAARRGETSRFSIDLAVRTAAASQLPATPGEKPANAGGEYMSVFGLAAGDSLNVRAGPSTGFGVIDRLPPGEVVRNLGCSVNQSGQSWCEVHRIGLPRQSGWASARYLRDAKAPGGGTASQLPGPSPVTTTGRITCQALTVSARCPYSVTRRGNGDGTLVVTLLPGVQRRIEFSGGRPVSSNVKGEIFAEWKGSDVIVTIGGLEIYTVPNSVLFGG